MTEDMPEIRMKPGRHKRIALGHPWAYANEVEMDAAARGLPPGGLVRLTNGHGAPLGVAIFNPKPLIVGRLMTREPGAAVDGALVQGRLAAALALRERLYDLPYYRLVHAEADGLPGLIIDRFHDTVVLQVNTAGMERLLDAVIAGLDATIAPKTVLLRNDTAARALEGLDSHVTLLRGTVTDPLPVQENGCTFFAQPAAGQKTGWFYDQRDNRAFVAKLCDGRRVADFYSFSGGFGVTAAVAGASEVTATDSSQAALDLAAMAAEANGVAARCRFHKSDCFQAMTRLAERGEQFDVVVADPPAFVKWRKDLRAGLRGYRKLTRLAARLVAPGGILLVASCSHHAALADFAHELRRGLADAKRGGRVLRTAGAGPDHPVHPFLPESAYLKAEVLQLD